MSRKFFIIILVLSFIFGVSIPVFCQEDWEEFDSGSGEDWVVAEGTLSSIAGDGSYIIINDGTADYKLLTTEEFLEGANLEIGDKLKTYSSQAAEGLELIDYEYSYVDYDSDSGTGKNCPDSDATDANSEFEEFE